MKKITRSYGEHLKPVKLYLDDLEKVTRILSDVTENVNLSTDEYSLDNVRQLQELKREYITELEIKIREPHVSLSLKPDNVWLYISQDDPVSRGLFEKIKKTLLECKHPRSWLIQTAWMAFVAGSIVGGGIILALYGIVKQNYLHFSIGVASIVLSLLWSWYDHKTELRMYSIIILKHRIDTPPFFKRNADHIVLAFISAILGGVITLIVTELIEANR